ncbi:hypothetical protein G7062_10485 [Erysipelothrix sp. HDW6C]|uniref:replication-relaxation family protein n=1 Tax=Erysipelothrix sp. HDW6C TaxID=2714930 RepID=UPI00140E6536|nr:replication-relaxation family protein [Erysipelothrix sp. HDW6C]QIK70703.1 hypothetical protein G7062_10485 [Erysipelothrix sp. HDW6C]
MTNKIEVTDRDILIFKLLNKFRVLDAELIKKFTGFTQLPHLQRRLIQLNDARYIGRERDGNTTPYIYFLRNKGMTILNGISGQNERPYTIRNFSKSSITHELLVAEICHMILEQNTSLELDDLQTDRELRKLGYHPDKVGDIRIYKFKVNIEVENTQKTFRRYPKKFGFNEDGFGQLWILNGYKTLKHKLNDYIKVYVNDRYVEAILLDEIQYYDFNLQPKAEVYQRQQQLKFDSQVQEREDNKRQAEEDEKRREEMIARERAIIETAEQNKRSSFWRK